MEAKNIYNEPYANDYIYNRYIKMFIIEAFEAGKSANDELTGEDYYQANYGFK